MVEPAEFPHLRLVDREQIHDYTARGGGGGGEYDRPVRDRAMHAEKLKSELEAAAQAAAGRGVSAGDPLRLTYDLVPQATILLDSLERVPSGIRLLNVIVDPDRVRATVLVPSKKRRIVDALLHRYATELHSVSQRPKGQDLVESIDAIRLATELDLWTDNTPFPAPESAIWWEVWLDHVGSEEPSEIWARFTALAAATGLVSKPRFVAFPDRVVGLLFGSFRQWEQAPRLFLQVAELRRAKELPNDYVQSPPRFQAQITQDVLQRLIPPDHEAPAVCLLDTGVAFEHPLLASALAPHDAHAVEQSWGVTDHDDRRHGTTMAGIALFGADLPEIFRSQEPVQLDHRLESVKIHPRWGGNDPDSWGRITQDAVARAEIAAPARQRAVCLTTTADCRDGGLPSSWSAALDQLCYGGEIFGEPKLVCVAAGNLREQIFQISFAYPCLEKPHAGIEDPAQSWNALTVGAFTERVIIQDPTFAGYHPMANSGDLSPTSRTSYAWPDEARTEWPLKPDIVMEGGNWVTDPSGNRDTPDDLGLLTTQIHPVTGSLLTITRDTSPATAAAARMAALIWSRYPQLRPETVRGLMVHSARWTNAMLTRFPGSAKATIQDRLRCYGFGVPSIGRAIDNANNVATVYYEGELSPYKHEVKIKTDEMQVHELPWPVRVLEELGAELIRLRVTLSYFIEPSPGRRGWTRRHRYASHGLRFALQKPTQSLSAFISSITATDDGVESTEDQLPWYIGSKNRSKGSIHSDFLELTAAQLAQCQHLAVYPVTGWWRERRALERWDSPARYSLIVTLESEASSIYAAIANEVATTIRT